MNEDNFFINEYNFEVVLGISKLVNFVNLKFCSVGLYFVIILILYLVFWGCFLENFKI